MLLFMQIITLILLVFTAFKVSATTIIKEYIYLTNCAESQQNGLAVDNISNNHIEME